MGNVIKEFIKPELIVLIPVIYVIGVGLKKTNKIKNEFIPVSLGATGILLSVLYVIGTSDLSGYKQISIALFTAITQGILVSGCSVYVNQLIKQRGNKEGS